MLSSSQWKKFLKERHGKISLKNKRVTTKKFELWKTWKVANDFEFGSYREILYKLKTQVYGYYRMLKFILSNIKKGRALKYIFYTNLSKELWDQMMN